MVSRRIVTCRLSRSFYASSRPSSKGGEKKQKMVVGGLKEKSGPKSKKRKNQRLRLLQNMKEEVLRR